MTQQIRELMAKAGMQFKLSDIPTHIAKDGTHTVAELYVYDKFDPEKFAELIVRECIAQCESNSPEVDQWTDEHVLGEHFAVNECVLSIKQHFGVEE